MLICLAASASADEPTPTTQEPIPPSAFQDAMQAPEGSSPLTDVLAAQQLPHADLDRPEALKLMRSVFGPVLQSAAGPFDDLHVEKFLSDNSAIIAAGNQPDPSGVMVGKGAAESGYDGPTLIASTVPLRTSAALGGAAVDLGLERSSDDLEAANPLVSVTIPKELGEGIALPESDIQIELANAPEERTPSIIETSVAAYPNVARDSSFVVAPTPTGLETMTLLQSADAPTSQTYDLTLPGGSTLEKTETGGATITKGAETLLAVQAPTAIDAAGEAVPVSLHVSGDSITVTASPDASSSYPIMVDPTFTYNWRGGHEETTFADWVSESNNSGLVTGTKAVCTTSCGGAEIGGQSGLDVFGKKGSVLTAGSNGTWNFYVPRYFTDQEQYGVPPQSFVTSMVLQNLDFYNKGHERSYLPAWVSGIYDQIGAKYTSNIIHGGMPETRRT